MGNKNRITTPPAFKGKKGGYKFRTGSHVFVISQGLGTIVGRRTIGEVEYFDITKLDNGSVLVPIKNAQSRMRPLMNKSKARAIRSRVLAAKRQGIEFTLPTWGARYYKYIDKLQSGDPDQICDVVVELEGCSTFSAKDMYTQTAALLGTEYFLVTGKSLWKP